MTELRARWVHTPLVMHHMGIKIEITKEGRVVLSNEAKSNEEEFDEISLPASVIFRTVKAIQLDAKQIFDIEYRGVVISINGLKDLIKYTDEGDEGIDEITVPSSVIFRAMQALQVTRKQEFTND